MKATLKVNRNQFMKGLLGAGGFSFFPFFSTNNDRHSFSQKSHIDNIIEVIDGDMKNVSFVGTIKSFDVIELDDFEKIVYVNIKENDLCMGIDSEILERTQLISEKGKAYLFTGDIHCFKPSFVVQKIIDKPFDATSEKLTYLYRKNSCIFLAISRKIIEVRCQTTMRGKTIAYAKIEGVNIPEILFFPDQAKRCLSAYQNKEDITIIVELQMQTPEFTVEKVEQYNELLLSSEEDIG